MSGISYLSKEGMEKLKSELAGLKTTGRASIAQQLREARDKGYLSENAEYDAAKEAQGMLELKINQLEELMANARVLDDGNMDISKALLMTTVKIRNLSNKSEMKYTLVSEKEADLQKGKISSSSPIGKALLGKAVGEVVEVNVPSGKIKFEIIKISR